MNRKVKLVEEKMSKEDMVKEAVEEAKAKAEQVLSLIHI